MIYSVQAAFTAVATIAMSSDWLCYGVSPVVAGALGFILASFLVYILAAIGVLNKANAIDYCTKETREEALKNMHAKMC